MSVCISRREFVKYLGAAAIVLPASPATGDAGQATFDVRQHGAKGDGRSKDTRAIQAAIDACHRSGGGTVSIPPGTFISGSLRLESGVALHLDHGATLKASQEEADFDPEEKLSFSNDADRETSFFHHALIWGEGSERIAITGTGTIDGNREKRGGPKVIALKRCQFVTISGITILHAPNYAVSLLGSDHVLVNDITIRDAYADGIDPDCCHHVRIANCHIESWDDAIVAKTSFSLGKRRSTENLAISNCILASNCNALKLGTESGGDFKNIAMSNCVLFARPGMRPPVSGISLLSVDGSNIDGVAIDNITMTGVRCPLFLRLGNRGRDMPRPIPGTLKNVVVSNLVASGAEWPCTIAGIPGHEIEEVTLQNLRVGYRGGGSREQGRMAVPEQAAKYPSADMFGILPAHGIYLRHAHDLHLSHIKLTCGSPDLRSAMVCDDVSGLGVEALEAQQAKAGAPLLDFRQVRDALIRGCRPGRDTDVFLKVSGDQSRGLSLLANDFSRVRNPFELALDAPTGCVSEVANRK
jgi:Glycosyl hydrolases family 28